MSPTWFSVTTQNVLQQKLEKLGLDEWSRLTLMLTFSTQKKKKHAECHWKLCGWNCAWQGWWGTGFANNATNYMYLERFSAERRMLQFFFIGASFAVVIRCFLRGKSHSVLKNVIKAGIILSQICHNLANLELKAESCPPISPSPQKLKKAWEEMLLIL